MNATGNRRTVPDIMTSSGSGYTVGTPRHPSIIDPILSKRVCFYKSGDPQFSGLRMVINNRSFKTFDALLDSLSKKVPLPFGVRNITTPRGVHAIYTLDELEDGKSYICSDSRKVKPINLALARKKLPPWYHARPVSSRRRTVQQARLFPGHKRETMFVRTPKRLVVFRNGDPTAKHPVVLHKRTTPTFESILEYISELIQFHVVKLHTPDGRRVDGLPGLIMCSGTVVAAGREPFRPANYSAEKSPAPTLASNRMSLRRLKAFNRKKKSQLYTSKARNFSPSSERYIVNRIHRSIAESSCDLPSNHTNSVEYESGHMLESVAETEGDVCLADEVGGRDDLLPTEDDIEKSFRVNQDGSMTVEMKVRLTIKEEETIHWTTTLTRSSVANQLNATCLPEPEAEQEIGSVKSMDLQSSAVSIDTIKKDKTEDDNDEDPPSLGNGAFSESSVEEENSKAQMDVVSPRRVHTPGHNQIRLKQASVESMKSVTTEGIQEGVVDSYLYREQIQHEAMTEQYCMIKQSSTKPVPKPRRLASVDANIINSRNVSAFKSTGMTEILKVESSGEEVTETVLHIYEQQTCQDNFLANVCTQGVSASGIRFRRPTTSDSGQLSSSNEFEPELWRPSTASESISIWRAESVSVTSDLTLPSLKTGDIQSTNEGKDKTQQKAINKYIKVSSKPKVISRRVRRLMSPGKRQKGNSAEETDKPKKVKTFSSAGFIKKIYGSKSKSAKSMMKSKKGPTQNGDGGVATKSSQQSDDTIKCILKDPNIPSATKENTRETASFEKSRLNIVPNEVCQPRGILTRQTSVHQEKKNENESCYVSESMSLPAFNSSSSVTNEYVENWLEKADINPTAYSEEESKTIETFGKQMENGRCGESENKNGSMIVAEKVKSLEDTPEMQIGQTLKTDLLTENLRRASVKQRIRSFENKSSSPSREKTTVNQKIVHSHTTTTNTEKYNSLAQDSTEEIKPPEMSMGNEEENKTSPIKISLQKATPSNTLSMELPLPPPPPPEELPDNEYCDMDECSVASSPLYRLSSESSQMSDNHPLSISPTSDKAVSPTDHTMEMTTSIQSDIPSALGEGPLLRTPSIKRAPLVSNLSLDRKMSLRKACLDKYTICSDANPETVTSSPPINTVGDNVLSNGICPTGTQQPSDNPPEKTQQSNSILDLKNSSPCWSSPSPVSLTSEERMSSDSISSSEAPTPCDLPFKETKANKTQLLVKKEASSPKLLVKKVKLMSSPSPERKSQTKKVSSELPNNSPKLSSLHNHPSDKTTSPNIGVRKHVTPNASPSTDRKQVLYQPKVQKRPSPYSQSLDMASPPVKHKASRKVLSRSVSSDNASEPINKAPRKISSQRKRRQPLKSTADLDKAPIPNTLNPVEADQCGDNKVNIDDLRRADQDKSVTDTQITPRPLNIANQPNMKPVLEEICYSIKSIRQITQNKRPSCLEKSNSLPDFSSHVASTFGSSSKALLAFLSVMTLKEGITNLNMEELNANNVSCAEALKMIDSLREIASIEDSHELKISLSNLQQSASKQLLQSWKGFQELSDKCKSRSSTPDDSEQELVTEASLEKGCSVDENVIDEIMDNLDIPEELREELASFPVAVKSESSDKENISAGIICEPLKDNNDHKTSPFSLEDAVHLRDDSQDEKVNVDVSSIIKKFTEQSRTGNTVQAAKDKDGQNGAHPPAKPNVKQTPEERHRYGMALFVKEDTDGVQACADEVNQDNQGENKQEKGDSEDELNQDDESGSELEGEHTSSADKALEQRVCSDQSASSSEAGERHTSEEEPMVEFEEIQQESRESESNPESHSEQEEDKQTSSNYYAELSEKEGRERTSSPESQNRSFSDEEQPEEECTELSKKDVFSNPASPPNSVKEPQSQTGCMGLNVSTDESTDEPSSEEEQHETGCKELKVIVEESLSGNEEETVEEDKHLDFSDQTKNYKQLKALIEEAEEDKFSSEDEDQHVDRTIIYNKIISQNSEDGDLIENHDSCIKKEDEDSGNDHSSCEEHVEVEQPVVVHEQISSSIEEELSYYEKESSSEEEPPNVDRYTEESFTEYQEESTPATQSDLPKSENAVEKPVKQEITSQSVAERVSLLEKQAAEAQRRNNTTESPPMRQINAPPESEAEDSDSELPQVALSTRSAPQSSLSFSYDSSGVITTEPEGSRVRSIREMFLAKSATDIQHGHRRFPSPNVSELSELRAETSASGGYQSQSSSELSSGEDDSARKSITKGFVRRTIERLYGKKEANPDEEANERPPSAPKQKKKEHSSIFSPFHIARSKAVSELSYFNSANALDTLSEATRCVAFNAQVGPGDSVPIDNGRWLLRENTLIRKSVSDPVGINKTISNSPQSEGMCKDTEESNQYSIFSIKSEQEDKKRSFSRKCTYFSLPHASDSDACQDDLSTASKSSANGDSIIDTKDNSEDTKMWAERNGTLPGVGVTDFKMKDNKVHPLVQLPDDGEVVVVQPGKGQGVMNRRLQEPDMLDLLYNFCGQNCPIL